MAQQEHKVGQRLVHMWNCLKLSNDGVGNVNGRNYLWHSRGLNPDRGCCCPGLGLQGVCGASPQGWGQQWPPLWEMCSDKALTCPQVKELWKEVNRLCTIRGRWWSLETPFYRKQKHPCAELTWYLGRFVVFWGVRSRILQNNYKGSSNMGTVTPCGHLGCCQRWPWMCKEWCQNSWDKCEGQGDLGGCS